jgi:hypothetical protein
VEFADGQVLYERRPLLRRDDILAVRLAVVGGELREKFVVGYANAFATAKLFVPVIVIAIVGIVLTEIVVHLERYLSRWRISERERF